MSHSLKLKSPAQIFSDLAAFSIGLGLALWLDWNTTDLVWGLWLSSLLVGGGTLVAMQVYMLLSEFSSEKKSHGAESFAHSEAMTHSRRNEGRNPPARVLMRLGAAIFSLSFFAVHFGGFHLVHAFFLFAFFPLVDPAEPIDFQFLLSSFASFLPFVLALAWGERERVVRAVKKSQESAPYTNVVRMHLLIFFFGYANAMDLDHLLVFTVVYVLYFLPVRIVKRDNSSGDDDPRLASPGVT